MTEIIISGRGGQGVVTGAGMIAEAYFNSGYYAQCFPLFGTERRGSPVKGFVRLSKTKIYTKYIIKKADILIIMDPKLTPKSLETLLKLNAIIIINAPSSIKPSKEYSLWMCNMTSIAMKYKLGDPAFPVINTTMLGAFCKATSQLSPAKFVEIIKAQIKHKQNENIKAFEEAYNNTILVGS